ncbi:MAG TPA: peptidoglycan DD-metalloendopeptidase family protein [Nocardioidaceae bacterium]|nr:peptidoglycan DD-metalloendopeptidase family protein [Nocardioidaceae bacterium]
MKRRHRILLVLLLVVVIVGLVLDAFAMGTSARSDNNSWTWPLDPRPEIVDGFDPPDDPYGSGHRGADLASHVGQPVLAVAGGRVSFVGVIAGRGVVVVDHGAERSTYEPVIGEVRVDQPVQAGDPLGRLELVGSHCWPRACLHLGRIAGETYRDPLELLGGGGPIRLLPFHESAAAAPEAGQSDGGRSLPVGGPFVGPPSSDSATVDARVIAAIHAALTTVVREFA